MCKLIFTSVSHWISLLRHGDQFDIKLVPCVQHERSVNISTNESVPAVTNSVSVKKCMKNKRYQNEIRKNGMRSNTYTSILNHGKKSINK